MNQYRIVPKVDAVREFLEIAGDFTNPLEVVREAISNSLDAGAAEITLEFTAQKEAGSHVLQIKITDNGRGMNSDELQSFFDLGHSKKRNDPNLIGEKGHGTKVFFNCTSIQVETSRDNVTLIASMQRPFATLHDGKLPEAEVTLLDNNEAPHGTIITIKGFNKNQGERFTHEQLSDYIKWFTKFGSCEMAFGHSQNSAKVIHLKGLNVNSFEKIEFGHFFPDESAAIQTLFNAHLVRAPDFYCKKIVRSGTLKNFPFVHFDAVFYIEGNRVKQTYNKMLRRQGYVAPEGAYTVQERYGVWLCKDFIPIERKNEWIASKGSEFTKFHAFFNCQELSLTANRGSVANTSPEILASIREEVEKIYQRIISSDDWREIDWLESEVDAYLTAEREKKDFRWRQDRANRSNIAVFKGITLVEPSRESGVYALLIQLATLKPELFPFEIVDYDTHSGIDVIAKTRDHTLLESVSLFYVELKFVFEARMNHSFDNMRYVVCWDTAIKHDGKVTDLAGQERMLQVAAPEPSAGAYTGYFLQKNFKQNIEIFVLKDYLREKLGLSFRPRNESALASAKSQGTQST